MHVLIVPSWYRASKTDTQGSFFREQALALLKHGHQVGIIHPQHRSMRQWQTTFSGKYGFSLENDCGIPTLRMHTMTWFPRQIPWLNYLLWVRNGLTLYRRYVERYGQPDIVHAHGMIYGGLLGWKIKSRYRVPFVVTEHGTAYARKLVTPWQIKLATKAATQADCRLAVSEAFCNELAVFIGSHWQPCANVVSSMFTNYPLAESQSDCQKFTFVSVAYLTERKNMHLLITAFAQAFKNDVGVCLKIGGDGKERQRLELLAQELNVDDRIIFLGALERDEVRNAIATADSFVLASQYETFGVVVIEALALGKPVIVTRCGGPNLVVTKQDGLLVPPGDINAMAEAMQKLRRGSKYYDAQSIRDGCVSRFGEAAIAQRLSEIYQNVRVQSQMKRSL